MGQKDEKEKVAMESQNEKQAEVGDIRRGRETFAKKMDFLLACVGGSIGLGNVWRFPYLCYKNGGGAFLIPYFLAVITAGMPLFFLEVAVGQFMTETGLGAWRFNKLFQGLGITMVVSTMYTSVAYCVILAWCFYYLFASMAAVVPWSHCDNDANTDNCTTDFKSAYGLNNASNTTNGSFGGFIDPATDYWERGVLGISAGIEYPGKVKWDLALCLLLSWIVTFLCICKGIKSSGKVMYVTATSPYVLMFALLIRGATLPGALEGIKFYLTPDWEKLLDATVWVDAGTQVFFSFALGRGILTALGTFNDFHHNSYRDVAIFTACNCGTSILAGFVIFTVLGYMSYLQDVPIATVAKSGPGLAFIAYPTSLSQLPISPLWSVIFFIMLVMLGLDSLFVNLEGVLTPLMDMFPTIRKYKWGPTIFTAICCAFMYIMGLSMVTEGGMYVFQIIDFYAASRILIVSSILQCIIVAWVYGWRRFYDNMEMMFGFRINYWMAICWTVVTPLYSMTIFVMSGVIYSDLTYGDYLFPQWSVIFGWLTAVSSFIFIPGWIIVKLYQTPGTMSEKWRTLLRPRLYAHQMRPQDDPAELIHPEEETPAVVERKSTPHEAATKI